MRETLSVVESALAGGSGDSENANGAYSFEAHRLERVLAASRGRLPIPLPRIPRWAAVVMISIGGILLIAYLSIQSLLNARSGSRVAQKESGATASGVDEDWAADETTIPHRTLAAAAPPATGYLPGKTEYFAAPIRDGERRKSKNEAGGVGGFETVSAMSLGEPSESRLQSDLQDLTRRNNDVANTGLASDLRADRRVAETLNGMAAASGGSLRVRSLKDGPVGLEDKLGERIDFDDDGTVAPKLAMKKSDQLRYAGEKRADVAESLDRFENKEEQDAREGNTYYGVEEPSLASDPTRRLAGTPSLHALGKGNGIREQAPREERPGPGDQYGLFSPFPTPSAPAGAADYAQQDSKRVIRAGVELREAEKSEASVGGLDFGGADGKPQSGAGGTGGQWGEQQSGQRVPNSRTLEGKVPSQNLLGSLQDQAGVAVLLQNTNTPLPNIALDVVGQNDVTFTPPVIDARLELNDYELARNTLDDGREILNVRAARVTEAFDPATLVLSVDPLVQDALITATIPQVLSYGWTVTPTETLELGAPTTGLVIRAPRQQLERMSQAIKVAESFDLDHESPADLAGYFGRVLSGELELPPTDLAERALALSDAEQVLRGYEHYRQHDPELDRGSFSARRLQVPAPVIGDEGLGREGFRERYGVNPFVESERDRFSTFAMDVDTASYTRARTLLASGQLPDPKQVRTEEFVNSFPDPRDADPTRAFSVFCEGGPSPHGDRDGTVEQVQITVRARDLAPGERRPAILTFAIDTSGSMLLQSRLGAVRFALETLLSSLGPDDRVGIVAYGTQAYLVLPHTPARERERIIDALDSLAPLGSTNVEAGLDLAYRVADEVAAPRAVNRVLLCSDGVATSGARSAEDILQKVRVYADRGIYLSVVGFGQDRYDDAFLEQLADRGNGQYAYVQTPEDAVRLFRDNLPSALSVLARDAKIQVDFDPQVVRQYRLLGYENRDVKDEDFRNDKIDAGEVGPGSTVTAIYEIVRRPASSGSLGRVFLRYHDTTLGRVEELNFPIPPGVVATQIDRTSERFRLLASVAELAELLRGSYFARDGAYSDILSDLSRLSPATLVRPEVRTFVDMVIQARELSLAHWSSR